MASRKSWGALPGACGAACGAMGSSVSSVKLLHGISYAQQGNSLLIYIRNTVWEISGAGWGCLGFCAYACGFAC